MRIGYLTSEYPAPSHTFIMREVAELRVRGLQIETFSIRRPSIQDVKSDSDLSALEATTYIVPPKAVDALKCLLWCLRTRLRPTISVLRLALRHRAPGLRGFVYAWIYWLESLILARRLAEQRIDHIHNHFANPAAIVGLLATRLLGLKWSLTLHGTSEFDYPAGLLLREKIIAADFVVCASWFIRAQAMRVAPPDQWHKIEVVRCGLDLSSLPDAPVPTAQDNCIRLVYVARHSPEKGHAGLLQALANLRGRGLDVKLVLIGNGPDRQRIESSINELDLSQHCSVLGTLENDATLREVARSDIFVMASFMEGLPVVLMEALALEVCVVAPRVAGIPELVDDNSGMLFTPSNWNELADCVSSLANDEKLRKHMGRQGRKRVEEEFDIRRAVDPLIRRFSEYSHKK